MKQGECVKRSSWGGYWFIHEGVHLHGNGKAARMNHMIVAYLRDGAGYAPAQPYQQDLLADDWEIVRVDVFDEKKTEPETSSPPERHYFTEEDVKGKTGLEILEMIRKR
ncbi:Thoeris anti-defense Tad2 family protein [Alicyclobacillus tolerans]|nr:MW1434 family type I TA system toxin [Alicyclobacillus montanus]